MKQEYIDQIRLLTDFTSRNKKRNYSFVSGYSALQKYEEKMWDSI